MDFLKSYIPYTKENTISKGLTFAETMVSLDYNNQSKQENFLDFKEKILFCKDNKCPYSEDEFRTIANHISPGLAQVTIIRDTIQAVNPNK